MKRWGGEDSLASEDLIDLRPRAEVCQKHLIGRLCEDVRLHAVMLRYKSTLVKNQVQIPWSHMKGSDYVYILHIFQMTHMKL